MEVLASNETFSADMTETYKKLDIDPASVTTLDAYLSEYYSQILKKLKEVGAQGRQTVRFHCHPLAGYESCTLLVQYERDAPDSAGIVTSCGELGRPEIQQLDPVTDPHCHMRLPAQDFYI